VPHRLAIALQERGWIVRQDNPWARPNPMPESVKNRSTRCHSYVFQIVKEPGYFYDQENGREPLSEASYKRLGQSGFAGQKGGPKDYQHGTNPNRSSRRALENLKASGSARRNMLSVWRIPTQAFPGKHYACVDDETEVLTEDGWKRQSDAVDGMRIMAFDGERMSWRPATFSRYPFSGMLVSVEGRRLSMALTPNHRVVRRPNFRKGAWRTVRAEALTQTSEVPTAAPFDELCGLENPLLAELAGWVLTDGSYTSRDLITLYQSDGRGKLEKIESMFRAAGLPVEKKRRKRNGGREAEYKIRGEACRWIQYTFPHKEGTYSVLRRWDRSALEALWRGMTEGDGNQRPDGRVTFVGNLVKVDFYQALCARLGKTCRVTHRTGNAWAAFVSSRTTTGVRSTNGRGTKVGRATYSGVVWCPSVEGGMWLARRRGKPFITGNTFPLRIPQTCIGIGTSNKGVCPQCGAPFERITSAGEPDLEWQRSAGGDANGGYSGESVKAVEGTGAQDPSEVKRRVLAGMVPKITIGWRPSCIHYPDPCDLCKKPWEHGRSRRRVSTMNIRVRDAKKGVLEQKSGLGGEVATATEEEVEAYGDEGYKWVETDVSWPACDCRKPVPGVVLDPFAGSGTTLVKAKQMGRRSIGIELSPYYVDLVRQRLAEMT